MEKDNSLVVWTDNMSFKTEVEGYELIIDAHKDFGGQDKGPRPKPLLLTALGGCTSMDVVAMLKKMRIEYDDFRVLVEGVLSDEHPKYYNKIHVIYQITGDNIPEDKIRKAVELSEERYCGVNFMLKKAAEISSEIRINGDKI